MWMHTGYRVPDEAPIPSGDFTVLSCGHYRLQRTPRFRTARLQGRPDWQLLYMAAGRGHFLLEGEKRWVTAGQAVLYRPGEPQDYSYYAADKPEIYWVHFAGNRVEEILTRYGLSGPLLDAGGNLRQLPEEIIREIQQCRPLEQDVTALLLLQWLARLGQQQTAHFTPRHPLIDRAVTDFQTRYAQPFSLADYARSLPMEPGWFSRLFRQQVGVSPQPYLTALRMDRAAELLRSTDCPVGEIARLVGYDDPLYFSKRFARRFGVSPRQFRKGNR